MRTGLLILGLVGGLGLFLAGQVFASPTSSASEKRGPSGPLGRPAGPTPTPPVCGLAWQLVPGAGLPAYGNNYIFDLAARSATDIWAVGSYTDNRTNITSPLTEHWDGTSWQFLSTGITNALVSGITTVAPDDVWAVGYSFTAGDPSLFLHWDGSHWQAVPSPPSSGGHVRAVQAVTATDIWAVGYRCCDVNSARTLIEHWDGQAWSVVPSPNVGNGGNELWDLSVVDGQQIWAVGYYSTEDWTQTAPLILQWDGSQWQVCAHPFAPTWGLNILQGVAARAADDVWAVGYYNPGSGQRTLVMHWDGASWQVVPSPNRGPSSNYLTGITVLPDGSAWAVGYNSNPPAAGTTLVLYWDGSTWQIQDSPSPGSQGSSLAAVAAVTAQDVWAGGEYYSGNGQPFMGLLEHYTDPCVTPSPIPTATATVPLPPSATPTATPTATPGAPTRTPCPLQFTDVQPSDYFYAPVQYLACRGVISGYADGSYRPYASVTRGQLAKNVTLAFGLPLQTPPTPTFADVPPSAPFYPYIETLVAAHVVSGYADGLFRPGNPVTRGQLAKIVVAAGGGSLISPPSPHFTDLPPSSVFYAFVETAVCRGLLSGYADGTVRPGAGATRGQIAKIVYLAVTAPQPCAQPTVTATPAVTPGLK
ncbi:MAG TPA: S-layer homology domain-containing protein [Chloroflexia bacterium]|nr:S-layer homology domain-containing protein [Chloroflexia bacterium]